MVREALGTRELCSHWQEVFSRVPNKHWTSGCQCASISLTSFSLRYCTVSTRRQVHVSRSLAIPGIVYCHAKQWPLPSSRFRLFPIGTVDARSNKHRSRCHTTMSIHRRNNSYICRWRLRTFSVRSSSLETTLRFLSETKNRSFGACTKSSAVT